MHALHNAHLVRKVLPQHLTAPIPLIASGARVAHHSSIASQLRISQAKKRKVTNEKRKATRAANQAKKQLVNKKSNAIASASTSEQPVHSSEGAQMDMDDYLGDEGDERDEGNEYVNII
jgi:hypothetical protein